MKRFYLFMMLVLAASAYAATPNPGHDASRIGAGTFSAGNYVFPAQLNVNGDLVVDTSTFRVNATTNMVGIGTVTPQTTLHVVGTDTTAVLRLEDTGGGEQNLTRTMHGLELIAGGMNTNSRYGVALKFMSDDPQFTTESPKLLAAIAQRATESYGADTDGGTALDFATTPVNPGATNVPIVRMSIDDSGSIGIGTMSPTQLLDVNGSINVSGTSGILYTPQVCLAGDCRTTWPSIVGISSAGGWTNTTLQVSLSDSNDNISAGAFFVDNTNDSIGIGTTSPQKLVHAVSTTREVLVLEGSSNSNTFTTDGGQLQILNTDTTANNYGRISFMDVLGQGAAGAIGLKFTDHTNNYGDLSFWTRGADDFSERMTVLARGTVGINTTAPNMTLDVTGTGRFSSTLTASNGFTLTAGALSLPTGSVTSTFILDGTINASDIQSSTTPDNGEILAYNSTSGGFYWTTDDGGSGNVTGGGSSGYIAKWTTSTNIGDSIIYDTGSAVGIGTATPSGGALNVVGSVNVTNGSITATPATPVVAGTLTNAAYFDTPKGIAVHGKYAYMLAATNDTFNIIDISVPTSPVLVASLGSDNETNFDGASSIVVDGRYAYLSTNVDNTLTIIDVADPSNPSVVGVATSGTQLDGIEGLALAGRYIFVASADDDLLTAVDVSDPTAPAIVSSTAADTTDTNELFDIAVQGKYAYGVARFNSSGGTTGSKLTIFDVSDPASMVKVSSVTSSLLNDARSIAVSGPYAYVTGFASNNLVVFDVTNASNPTEVGSLTDAVNLNAPFGLSMHGKYAYVTGRTGDQLTIVDVSSPTNPRVVQSVSSGAQLDGARDVVVTGRYAYVLSEIDDMFTVVDLGYELPSFSTGSLAAGQLFVQDNSVLSGNAVIGGTANIGGNALIGKGLAVSEGEVSLPAGEIDSDEIADSTIDEIDLNASNSPTNGYVLTYNSATGGFAWAVDAGGTGVSTAAGWTNTTTQVSLSDSSDNVSANTLFIDNTNGRVGLGTTSPTGKLHIVGAPGSIWLRNTALGGREWRIGEEENSGKLTIYNNNASAYMLTINGSNGYVGMGTTNPTFPLEIRASGNQLALNDSDTGDTWIIGTDNNVDLSIAEGSWADANIRFHINDGGNIGIGTTAPTQKLEAKGIVLSNGSATSTGFQLSNAGTASGGVFTESTWRGSGTLSNMSISAYSGKAIKFFHNGGSTEAMTIDTDGDVGIGTTAPAYKLDVNGNTRLGSNGHATGVGVVVDGVINLAWGTSVPSPAAGVWSIWHESSDGTIRFKDSAGDTNFYIDDSGNVAIGNTPQNTFDIYVPSGTNPTMALRDGDIAHGITDYAPTDASLKIGQWGSGSGGAYMSGFTDVGTHPALTLQGIQGSNDPTNTVASVLLVGNKQSGTGAQAMGSAETVLQIATGVDGATKLFTVLGSGEVGVGTVTPGHDLTVADEADNSVVRTIAYSDTAAHAGVIQLGHARGTESASTATQAEDVMGSVSGVGWDTALGTGASIEFIADAEWGTAADASDEPTRIAFFTAPDGSAAEAERMRITSSGNVGIGVTSPLAKLEVGGNGIRITGAAGALASGSGMEIGNTSIYTYNRDTSQYNAMNIGDSLYIVSGAAANRNVGVGTATPAALLEIEADGSSGSPGSYPSAGRFYVESWAGDGPAVDAGVALAAVGAQRISYLDTNAANAQVFRVALDDRTPLLVRGNAQVYLSDDLFVGYGAANDDDYIYMDAGAEQIRWEEANTWFEFSDKIRTGDEVQGSQFIDNDNSNYYINPAGQSILAGDISIGTTGAPSTPLDAIDPATDVISVRTSAAGGSYIKFYSSSTTHRGTVGWSGNGVTGFLIKNEDNSPVTISTMNTASAVVINDNGQTDFAGDIRINGNDLKDSGGTTRQTLGSDVIVTVG